MLELEFFLLFGHVGPVMLREIGLMKTFLKSELVVRKPNNRDDKTY